jgi:hypothetical protein
MTTFHMLSLCHKRKPPNIQIQGTGICIMLLGIWNLSAADLERSAIQRLPLLSYGQEPQHNKHHKTRDPMTSVCISSIETS